jgi:hypothetical protein
MYDVSVTGERCCFGSHSNNQTNQLTMRREGGIGEGGFEGIL